MDISIIQKNYIIDAKEKYPYPGINIDPKQKPKPIIIPCSFRKIKIK